MPSPRDSRVGAFFDMDETVIAEKSGYTRLETLGGRFRGRVIEPVCVERGELHWPEQLVFDQRIDLARGWCSANSITDPPLPGWVRHPVVTNPDPRPYPEAGRRRGPVRFFTPPEFAGRAEV